MVCTALPIAHAFETVGIEGRLYVKHHYRRAPLYVYKTQLFQGAQTKTPLYTLLEEAGLERVGTTLPKTQSSFTVS